MNTNTQRGCSGMLHLKYGIGTLLIRDGRYAKLCTVVEPLAQQERRVRIAGLVGQLPGETVQNGWVAAYCAGFSGTYRKLIGIQETVNNKTVQSETDEV